MRQADWTIQFSSNCHQQRRTKVFFLTPQTSDLNPVLWFSMLEAAVSPHIFLENTRGKKWFSQPSLKVMVEVYSYYYRNCSIVQKCARQIHTPRQVQLTTTLANQQFSTLWQDTIKNLNDIQDTTKNMNGPCMFMGCESWIRLQHDEGSHGPYLA